MNCIRCNSEIPCRYWQGNKLIKLDGRKFCLDCKPFGERPKNPIGRKLDNEYFRHYMSEWRKEAKLALIIYKGGKCQKCGIENDCPAIYDFHHKDPSKKDFCISGSVRSLDKMKEEVDKCDMLCKNCHAIVHWKLRLVG